VGWIFRWGADQMLFQTLFVAAEGLLQTLLVVDCLLFLDFWVTEANG